MKQDLSRATELTEADLDYFSEALEQQRRANYQFDFVKSVLTARYGLVLGDTFTPEGGIIRLSLTQEISDGEDSKPVSVS